MTGGRRSAGLLALLVVAGLALWPVGSTAAHGLRSARSAAVAMQFHSQSFHPPSVSVSSDPDQSSGDILLTPRNGYQRRVSFQPGPMIITGQGRLVWFHPLGSLQATNLEVQRYQGQPVLTWWQGTAAGKHAKDMIMNSSYQVVAEVRAGPGYQADTHEFQITPQNTALIDAVAPVKADLTSYGGPKDGTIDDCVIEEIDIPTGHVIWHWRALAHVPLKDSYVRPTTSKPFDYFHLNSIQQLLGGNLLISARGTWGVYEINKRNGRIVWTVGGKRSSFKVGKLARFEWQHDARLAGNTLSLFDDASDGPEEQEPESSGKLLLLNFKHRTAVLDRRFVHSPPLLAVSQGNVQTLANHNIFIGWGSEPNFSEYTSGGRQILNGSFPVGVQSYRAYRFPWSAQPASRPSMAAAAGGGGGATVWASWNGATTVSAWRVLGGSTVQSLRVVDPRTPLRGFETSIRLNSDPRYLEVQALGAAGQVLGTSTVHRGPSTAADARPR